MTTRPGLPGPGASGPPWAVTLEVPLHWGEMDALGHVNNAVYFRWFESARMSYFDRLGWPELQRETGIGPILHSTRARYRASSADASHNSKQERTPEAGQRRR